MNYTKLYNKLIQKAKNEQQLGKRVKHKDEYFESHHVIPRCLNGLDDLLNLVLLTAREHFLAHWILTKIYPTNHKLVYAFNCFCRTGCNHENHTRLFRPKSKLYKYAREKYIYLLKHNDKWKQKMGKTMEDLVWIKNNDTKECFRIHKCSTKEFLDIGYKLGRIINHRYPHTKVTKHKMSLAKLGKKISNKHKKSIIKQLKTRIWINNSIKSKHISKEKADNFIFLGWKLGRVKNKFIFGKNKNKVVVNKNGKCKFIDKDTLQNFLKRKWCLGNGRSSTINWTLQKRQEIQKRFSDRIWINNGIKNKRCKKIEIKQFIDLNWKYGRLVNGKLGNNQHKKDKNEK